MENESTTVPVIDDTATVRLLIADDHRMLREGLMLSLIHI